MQNGRYPSLSWPTPDPKREKGRKKVWDFLQFCIYLWALFNIGTESLRVEWEEREKTVHTHVLWLSVMTTSSTAKMEKHFTSYITSLHFYDFAKTLKPYHETATSKFRKTVLYFFSVTLWYFSLLPCIFQAFFKQSRKYKLNLHIFNIYFF